MSSGDKSVRKLYTHMRQWTGVRSQELEGRRESERDILIENAVLQACVCACMFAYISS